MTRNDTVWLRYSFSPREDMKIVNNWPDKTVAEISKILGKPQEVVAKRIPQLRKEGHYLPHKVKKWTSGHDKKVIELWPDVEKTTKETNRTPGAVMSRARTLRRKGVEIPGWVEYDPPERHGEPWEKSEDKALIENVERLGFVATANKLKRSPRSIAYRVLHLSKDNGFSPETISRANELIENYNNPETRKGDDVE